LFLQYFAANFSETITDEMMQRLYKPDVVLASMSRLEDPIHTKLADVPSAEKLEKFVEDVKLEFEAIKPLSCIQSLKCFEFQVRHLSAHRFHC
jgi:hypothetical protein